MRYGAYVIAEDISLNIAFQARSTQLNVAVSLGKATMIYGKWP